MTFKIESKDIQLVDESKLVLNPKNMNSHSKEQIARLEKLIEFQGFRNPIIVSNRTGFVVAGHGRIEAARKIGMNLVPVMYQDFDSEAQEYAYMVSDNAIASWSELDLSAVNTEMLDLGPDFDIEMLGIKDFTIEIADKKEDKEVDLNFNYKLEVDCEDEDKQQMLLMELQDREFKVRVLL